MTHKIEIKMVLESESEDSEDVTIATLTPAIEVTAADDEETLMDKVYTHIDEWWQRTGNVGCTPHYSLDELIAVADRM
jgi:hypothetical protein